MHLPDGKQAGSLELLGRKLAVMDALTVASSSVGS